MHRPGNGSRYTAWEILPAGDCPDVFILRQFSERICRRRRRSDVTPRRPAGGLTAAESLAVRRGMVFGVRVCGYIAAAAMVSWLEAGRGPLCRIWDPFCVSGTGWEGNGGRSDGNQVVGI